MTLADHKLRVPQITFGEHVEQIKRFNPIKTILLSVVDCSDTEQLTKLMVQVYDKHYQQLYTYPVKALSAQTAEESQSNFHVLLPVMLSFRAILNSSGFQRTELWDELIADENQEA